MTDLLYTCRFIRSILYFAKITRAIGDGSDVRGYFVWTMIDNFEWASGLSHPMGFVRVDHETQERTVKESAYWYRDLIESQGLYEQAARHPVGSS